MRGVFYRRSDQCLAITEPPKRRGQCENHRSCLRTSANSLSQISNGVHIPSTGVEEQLLRAAVLMVECKVVSRKSSMKHSQIFEIPDPQLNEKLIPANDNYQVVT